MLKPKAIEGLCKEPTGRLKLTSLKLQDHPRGVAPNVSSFKRESFVIMGLDPLLTIQRVFQRDFNRTVMFLKHQSLGLFGSKFEIGSLGKLIERCALMRRTFLQTYRPKLRAFEGLERPKVVQEDSG